MKKLLKTLACSAVAALVGASAFANYDWYDTSIGIGGIKSNFQDWSKGNGAADTDLGALTSLTLSSVEMNIWDDDNDRGGVNMFFRLYGDNGQIGGDVDVWLGGAERIEGSVHDFSVSYTGPFDLADAFGVTLEDGKTYYLNMWAKSYGDSGDHWYNGDGDNYHTKFVYCGTPKTYTLVESADDLVVGADYLVVSTVDGAYSAMKNEVNGTGIGCLGLADDAISGNTIAAASDAIVWQLNPGQAEERYQLYSSAAGVFAADSDDLAGRAQLLADGDTDLARWTVDLSALPDVKFYSVSYPDRCLQRDNFPANERFAAYDRAHVAPRLYRDDSTALQTVTFNAQGGTSPVATRKYVKGRIYWGIRKPEWAGEGSKKFMGWFDAPEGGNRVTNYMAVTDADARTIYAHWGDYQTVYFDANGGTYAKDSVVCGGTYSGLTKPVWEGEGTKKFLGWYDAPENGERVLNGDPVTGGAEKTLYAYWGGSQTVYFDANGGTYAKVSVECLGTYTGLTKPSWPNDERKFVGWFDAREGGERVLNYMPVTGGAEKTLYAHWADYQTVYFNANGGSYTKTSVVCAGTYTGLTKPEWTGEGTKKFLGWYDALENGERVLNGDPVTGGAEKTLYAYWGGSQTVYFDANGGTYGKTSVECLGTYTGLTRPTWDGHKFLGWYDALENGERVLNYMPVSGGAEKTLYAHWADAGLSIAGFSMSSRAKAGARAASTVTDTITAGILAATSTTYTEFSGVDKTKDGINSDAVYAGKNSKNSNGAMQLRISDNSSGIVTTGSGGAAKSVTVVWQTTPGSDSGLYVYGKTSSYSAATDLYDSTKQGTLLGTITSGTAFEITGDYTYIGLKSKKGTIYPSSIAIEWTVASSDQSVTLSPAGPIEAEVGDEVIITATADGFSGDVNWSWTGSGTPDGNRFTVDTTSAFEAATITATATYGTETASQSVTVTVVAPPPPSVTLEASATEVEVGDVVTVTATAANFSGEVTWEWAGDGSAVGNVFTVDTSVAGDHLIMVEATCGDESADAEVTITVKEPGVEEDYALVSSLDELSDGTAVILTDEGSNYALPATISGSVFGVTPVAPVNDVISTDDASIVWTLVSDGNGHFSLYSADAGKYAGHGGGGSSNSGQLQDDAFPHAIELDGGLFVFTATTADSSGNYRTLQFNQNGTNPRFAYYKGTQTDLKIYAKSTPPVVEPTVTLEASATEVEIGEEVTITATAENFDAPASDLIWEWKVGETVDPTQEGTTFTWTPSAAGTYTVTATASDGDNIDADSVTITVNAPVVKYAITIASGIEHGSVTTDPANEAAADTPVTVTADPDPGYVLETLKYNDTDIENGSFTMPAVPVTITATFVEAPATPTYTLVESADDVVVGADYLIVASGAGFTNAMKNELTTTSTKRLSVEDVDIVGKTITTDSDAIVWQLKPGNHKGQRVWYSAAANVYAAAPSSATASAAQLLADGTDDLAQWTLDLSDMSAVKIVGVSYTSRMLQRNSQAGNPYFASYAAGQTYPRLYRADSTRLQTVTFDPNGGTYYDDMLTMKYVKGKKYWGIWKPAAREGYKFLGWIDEEGARIQNGQIITEDDTRTFTAQWVQLQTVTFDANGGTLRGMESKEFRCDGVYAGFAKPVRDGYTFMGWFDEDGTRVKNGEAVSDDAERTLYAHWGQTVRFDGNGGTVRGQASLIRDIAGEYSGFAKPAREGNYKFLGWFDENDQRVKNGDDVTEDAERWLYAHWTEAVLTIRNFGMKSAGIAARDARIGGGQEVELSLVAVAGVVYEVEWTDSLDGEWTVLKRWTADDDGETSVTVTVPSASASGFFRITAPMGE